MSTLLRFLQFFSLGTWVGSIVFFGAVVAPGAFTVLSSRDQAGALVGLVLGRLHLAGMVAGVIFLIVTAIVGRSPAALARPAPLLVAAMIVLTFVSEYWVTGTMEGLRAQMISKAGSLDATPVSDALRVSFDRLHVISVRLEMAVLGCGVAALGLLSRRGSSLGLVDT